MPRGRKPSAQEMVIPRRAHEFFERGKVTARYTLRLGKGRRLDAVRVHAFPGHAVFHFSLDEFNRLFRAEKERVAEAQATDESDTLPDGGGRAA